MRIVTCFISLLALLAFPLPTYAQISGLVAHYPLDGDATDASGNGHDGTVSGATPTADRFGIANGALHFDGVDDLIDPDLPATSATGFSFCSWLKTESLSATQLDQSVYGGRTGHTTTLTTIFTELNDGSSVYAQIDGGVVDRPTIDSGISVHDGQWHHVCSTLESNAFKLYLDAVLIGFDDAFDPGGAMTTNVFIGAYDDNGTAQHFYDGDLDDIRIYDRALSENEVATLYGSTGLVAHYPLDGDATDASGNGLDGTVNGATPTENRFGTANSAYSFDGVDDFISVPHDPSLNLPNNFAFSVWALSDVMQTPNNYVLAKGEGAFSHEYAIFFANGSNKPWVSINSASASNSEIGPGVGHPTNVWTHLAAVAEAGTLTLYIDGVVSASGSYTYASTSADLFLGVLGSYFYRGAIDDVRIYNRALTEDEVIALYVEGVVIPVSDQLADIEDEILALVDAGVLNNGQGTSLINDLKNAFKEYEKGKTDGAIQKLEHFIGRVQDLTPPLSAEEAQALTDAANGVITTIQDEAAGKGVLADEETPTRYALGENYPNPFNPVTVIRYDLPEASAVTLQVFDVMGRRVAMLVSGPREAGRHEVAWDATDVASGVYLYRLQAGSFVETKSMVLMR